MQISHIVKKWRDSGQEEGEMTATASSFKKVVCEVLSYYEKERENLQKQLPLFVNTLQEESKEPEKKEPKKRDVVKAAVKQDDFIFDDSAEGDDWDREMRDFTRGLFGDEDFREEEEEEPEQEQETFEEPAREEEEIFDDEIPELDIEPEIKPEVKQEPKREKNTEFDEEFEPLNLEKLLQTMKDEAPSRENAKNKGSYRRVKRNKRTPNTGEKKRKRKKPDWQDSKKNK